MKQQALGAIARLGRRRVSMATGLGMAATVIMMSLARAEPVVLGSGDDPPARIEITSRRKEITTRRAGVSSLSLDRTFAGSIDRAASGVRRMVVRLTQLGAEVEDDNELVRLAGDIELDLLQCFKGVELILAFDDNGAVISVDNWDEVHTKIAAAVERRVAVLRTDHPAIHPATALPAETVEQLDQQVTKGFVEKINTMSAAEFFQEFYREPALILIASNARLDIGETVRRSTVMLRPDGRPVAATESYRLRELDVDRTRGLLDILPDDSLGANLREALIEGLRQQKLDEADIRARVDAMAINAQSSGTAEVDVASGRLRHMQLDALLHLGSSDYATHEEITFAPIP